MRWLPSTVSVSSDRTPRIIVFRTGHLGDTVCAIPAFRLLRQHFRDAHLTLLCDRPAGSRVAAWDVIQRLGLFDRIVSYQSGRGWATLQELRSLIRQLRPQAMVQLPQVDRTPRDLANQRLFFRLSGVRNLIGFRPRPCHEEWHPDEPQRLIRVLNDEGIEGTKPEYAIPLDQPSLSALWQKAAALGIDLEQPYLVFCGGGKTPTQRWPMERYAAVLKQLHAKLHIPMIGIGGTEDLEIYHAQIRPLFPALAILNDPLPIMELAELLRFATLYFGNDTGPMHLAAAVGCPVAAVISARNKPGRWDPDIEPRLIIRHRVPCEGCRLYECVREGHRCMAAITVEQVAEQLQPFVCSLLEPHRLQSRQNGRIISR
jgi:ADP-heptose:LPS heptosyltransferase